MRTYVVTGSASGIGAATARQLTEAGHWVIGVDLHDADVEVDLATGAGRQQLVEGVRGFTGTIDAVIACAGIAHQGPPTIQVNFFGCVATLEGLRPLLLASEAPRAVAISSVASLVDGDPGVVEACLAGDEALACERSAANPFAAYMDSKRALARWIRRTAPTDDWAAAGIPLNAVAPGVIVTPMTADLISTEDGRALVDGAVPMPLGGYAPPEAVADLLCYLASPGNTRVTGQVVFVDGGADAVTRGDSVW